KGNHPRSVGREVARRAGSVEMDQNSLDGLPVLDDSSVAKRIGDGVLVSLSACENVLELGIGNRAGDDVGIERVDERVGLGVVADEHLLEQLAVGAALRGELGPSGKERRQLVAELIAERPETQPQDVPQVRLQSEAVPARSVEAQLFFELVAQLLRAA